MWDDSELPVGERVRIPRRRNGEAKRFWYDNGHVHHLRDDGTISIWSIHCGEH